MRFHTEQQKPTESPRNASRVGPFANPLLELLTFPLLAQSAATEQAEKTRAPVILLGWLLAGGWRWTGYRESTVTDSEQAGVILAEESPSSRRSGLVHESEAG